MLPSNVRSQVLYLVRDYDRMLEEADAILEESGIAEGGMPKGSGMGDPVAQAALRREHLLVKIGAIEKALEGLPDEYRRAVFDNAKYRVPYPDYADRTTFWRYRAKFFYKIAKLLHMV